MLAIICKQVFVKTLNVFCHGRNDHCNELSIIEKPALKQQTIYQEIWNSLNRMLQQFFDKIYI